MKETKTYSLSIDSDLLDKIKDGMKENGFSSIEEYMLSILRKSVNSTSENARGSFEDEEKKVKDRLRSLGYLD